MRTLVWKLFAIAALTTASSAVAFAQGPGAADPAEPQQAPAAPAPSRQALIEQEQADKDKNLKPYIPNKGERLFQRLDTIIAGGTLRMASVLRQRLFGRRVHARSGPCQLRQRLQLHRCTGSYTISGYKRVEAEFVAPRLFNRRGHLSVLGGWREATQVGFYGIGTNTSKDDRTNYLFQQPYGVGAAERVPDAPGADAARWRRVHPLDAEARRRHFPVGRNQVHAGDTSRAWARK